MAVIFALRFVVLSASFIGCFGCCGENSTLQLVIALFKHGDRTPDSITYPKDPFCGQSYFPYGNAELTTRGKQKMYRLGEVFREMYDTLLGPLYLPGLIDALTTNYRVAESSLQLFLAGLFPPCGTVLDWYPSLNWNPIPYNKAQVDNRVLVSSLSELGPKFKLLYDEYKQSAEFKKQEYRYRKFFDYVEKYTGLTVNYFTDLVHLYDIFTAQTEFGLKLPKWTERIYPKVLSEAVVDSYKVLTDAPQLNQILGGPFLRKSLENMDMVMKGTPNQPKMYVYSANELSVLALLGALKLRPKSTIPFGACVILELHRITHKYYIKVLYNDGDFKFVYLDIPGCTEMCSIEDFKSIVQ